MAAIGGNDLHRCAGLLPERGSHGRTWTLLEGNDLESLFAVTPPEPGGSSPSEVSPTVPDKPVLSHLEFTLHRVGRVPSVGVTLAQD
jgi:hypothetical protein